MSLKPARIQAGQERGPGVDAQYLLAFVGSNNGRRVFDRVATRRELGVVPEDDTRTFSAARRVDDMAIPTITLASGHAIPQLGLGTWQLQGQACETVVKEALDLGYTHLDSAWMYQNQDAIGRALKEVGARREDLFITSKIWHSHLEYDAALGQMEEILRDLRTEYVDLLLIHHPGQGVPVEQTLAAFEKIHAAGQALSIGISNFSIEQTDRARAATGLPLCTNQVEYHLHHQRDDLRRHCHAHGIFLTAHRPLAKGELAQDGELQEIAASHGKSPAQIALKWLVQQDMIVIPKASSASHLRANLDLFDWQLAWPL
jgi:2,5-diketo-D-gluconate reductase B